MPTVSISDATVTEGDSGTTNATFTVSLSAPAPGPVSVSYATADGTATAPSDYAAATGTVSFTPGQQTKQVTVAVNGDTVPEPDETFSVNVSNPTDAAISDGTGQGTIVNNDSGPPPPLEPIEGVQVVADPQGVVKVRCPGEDAFRRLTATEVVAIGCSFDTRKGRVKITFLYNGKLQTMTYYDGRFKALQKKGAKPVLTAKLNGPLGCHRSSKAKASDVGEPRAKHRGRRHLWGNGKGRAGTKGDGGGGIRSSSKWLTADRCDGETLFRVRKGKVVIDDFDIPGRKNRVLKAGKSYVTKD